MFGKPEYCLFNVGGICYYKNWHRAQRSLFWAFIWTFRKRGEPCPFVEMEG